MSTFDVIVIGGGPAGSIAAATAARLGLNVLCLEAGQHPRSHVGESLLPGIIPILDDVGVLPTVQAAGFARKTGSTHWDWGQTPRWDLWFADSDAYDAAWFVERSRFDQILFEHARSTGVTAYENANVRAAQRDNTGRVTGVDWRHAGQTHAATARLVVDASGPAGLVSRRCSKRIPIDGLRHQAMWAHFEGARHLEAPRDAQALFIAESKQWFWAFPLGGGRTSVGLVQTDAQDRQGPTRRDFDGEVAGSARLQQALGPNAKRSTEVRGERDWSYRSESTAGPGWIAVGDAAGFIDPVLSTGVMLAIHSGWHAGRAAAKLCSSAEQESSVLNEYQRKHSEMFEDLLRMVRFYYRQNVDHHGYFWESKKILLADDEPLRPRKAFMLLTSGLVRNLAVEEIQHERRQRVETTGMPLDDADRSRLDFVAVHLRVPGPASLFLLIETADDASPTLFRTENWHVNAIAPRHGNDPIGDPTLAPLIRAFQQHVGAADLPGKRSLRQAWGELGPAIKRFLEALPDDVEYIRTFGE